MSLIPKNEQREYERVKVDDFIAGEIVDIEHDPERETTYKGKEKISSCIRMEFKLDGYDHPKYSRWLTFSYSEKSNLFKQYLINLVDGVFPYCDFDLEKLKGMKIKILYSENTAQDGRVFQNVDTIRPQADKLKFVSDNAPVQQETIIDVGEEGEDSPPF